MITANESFICRFAACRASKSADIRPDETGGDRVERGVLAELIEPDFIYLADHGHERYSLLALIVRAGSHYMIRCQEYPVDAFEKREISQAARVISDQIFRLGHSRREVIAVDHPVRRIVIGAFSQGKHRASRPCSDRNELLRA